MIGLVLCCTVSGLLFALSSPSCGFWPLVFVSFIPLLVITEKLFILRKSPFHLVFIPGLCFCCIAAVSCFYWVANESWMAMIAVSLVYGVVYSLFVPGIILGHKAGLGRTALSFWIVLLWVSLETLLSDIFLPIPSMSVGYFIWPFRAAIQIADLTGVFGVSFWIIMINVLLFNFLTIGFKRSFRFLCVTVLFTFVFVGYGLNTMSIRNYDSTIPPLTVSSIYTSISTAEKKNEQLLGEIYTTLKQQTIESLIPAAPDLVVWPETSLPVVLRSVRHKEYITDILALAQDHQISVLLGARSFQRNGDKSINKYNSAFLIPPKGFVSQEYRKNILVPFVEKNLFRRLRLPTSSDMNSGSQKFEAGGKFGIISLSNNISFGVSICYELFFPDFVRKSVRKQGTFLLNITNDRQAFANLSAAYQIPISHLVFRAVENRKYLVRSANWGYSMIISPEGSIVASSAIGSTGFLSSDIIPNSDNTFFALHGFLFAKIVLFITFTWLTVLIYRVLGERRKPKTMFSEK